MIFASSRSKPRPTSTMLGLPSEFLEILYCSSIYISPELISVSDILREETRGLSNGTTVLFLEDIAVIIAPLV